MAPSYAYPPLRLEPQTSETARSFLRTVILCLIAGAAVASREFAVVRFESIIHECAPLSLLLLPARRSEADPRFLACRFDPWFNYRATKVLTEEGFYVRPRSRRTPSSPSPR